MNAPLLTFGGTAGRRTGQVFALDGDVARPLAGLNRWVTHIADFPALQLTVLVTEELDTVVVIDAEKEIHRLTDLNLGEWTFISNTFFLADPPRLLMVAQEAKGPFRGLYLLQIEKANGVWRPSGTQDWTNLTKGFPTANHKGFANVRHSYDPAEHTYFIYGERYSNLTLRWLGQIFGEQWLDALGLYRVGKKNLIELNEDDPSVLETLPKMMKYYVTSELPQSRRVILPELDVSLEITYDSLEVVTVNNETHIPEGSEVLWQSQRPSVHAFPLSGRNEALLISDGQFFMLRDREQAGADACYHD